MDTALRLVRLRDGVVNFSLMLTRLVRSNLSKLDLDTERLTQDLSLVVLSKLVFLEREARDPLLVLLLLDVCLG